MHIEFRKKPFSRSKKLCFCVVHNSVYWYFDNKKDAREMLDKLYDSEIKKLFERYTKSIDAIESKRIKKES